MSNVMKAYFLGVVAGSLVMLAAVLFDGAMVLLISFPIGLIFAKIVTGLERKGAE